MNSAELRRVPPLGWLAGALLAQKSLLGGRLPSRTSLGLSGVIGKASLALPDLGRDRVWAPGDNR